MRILMMTDDTGGANRAECSRADWVEWLLLDEDADLVRAGNGAEGIERAQRDQYDVIFLDPNLPDLSGPEVLRRLREAGVRTPVVIVSDQAGVEAMSRGFGFGAEAFVSLPTTSEELIDRIYRVLGRVREPPFVINAGGHTVEFLPRNLRIDGERVVLPGTERQITELLARRLGELVSKEVLCDHRCPGHDQPSLGSIDVFVSHARRIMGAAASNHNFIETVRGKGYRFSEALDEPNE